MRKKFSSLLLALSMTACLLSGCGSADNNTTDDEVKVNQEIEMSQKEDKDQEVNSSVDSDETDIEDDEQRLFSVNKLNLCLPKEARGYEYENLHDFFTLLLEDYCEWMASDVDGNAYGVVNGRPFCVENMRAHGTQALIGEGQVLTMADPALIIVGDYDEDNFDYALHNTTYWSYGCGNDLYEGSRLWQTVHDNAGKTIPYSYGCQLVIKAANFQDFNYYKGTDAELQLIVDVEYTVECEGNKGVSDMTYAVTMVNNTEEPWQWLISGLYVAKDNGNSTYSVENYKMGYDKDGAVKQGDRIYIDDFDVNKMLVNEDEAEKSEKAKEVISQISEEELQEALDAYSQIGGDDHILFECGSSGIPYYSNGFEIYHYENGSVISLGESPLWKYDHLRTLKGKAFVCMGSENDPEEILGLYVIENGKVMNVYESEIYFEQYDAIYNEFLEEKNEQIWWGQHSSTKYGDGFDKIIDNYMSIRAGLMQ